jgi:hypothetical protein
MDKGREWQNNVPVRGKPTVKPFRERDLPNQPIHLMVGTPCYGGQVTVPYFTAALRLRDYCGKNGIRLTFAMPWGDALVTRARQSIAAYFLEDPTATHLLYIDADISYEVEQVLRLLRFNREVCAGLYPLKRYDWERVRKTALAGSSRLESAGLSYVIDLGGQHETIDGFAQVTQAGTGFLMVQRPVLEAMAKRYPELKYKAAGSPGEKDHYAFFRCLIDEKGVYLSEDYSFCKRWTDMGGEIWADFQSRLNHMGPEIFRGDVAQNFSPAPRGEPS